MSLVFLLSFLRLYMTFHACDILVLDFSQFIDTFFATFSLMVVLLYCLYIFLSSGSFVSIYFLYAFVFILTRCSISSDHQSGCCSVFPELFYILKLSLLLDECICLSHLYICIFL